MKIKKKETKKQEKIDNNIFDDGIFDDKDFNFSKNKEQSPNSKSKQNDNIDKKRI